MSDYNEYDAMFNKGSGSERALAPEVSSSSSLSSFSENQVNIFEAVKNGTENLFVMAGPGTGKTTTIVEAAKYAPKGSVFLAFNKKIAEELDKKLPDGVMGSTMHKFGKDELKDRLPRFKISGNKTLDIVERDFKNFREWKWDIKKAVSFGKGHGMGVLRDIDDKDIWLSILENQDMTDIDGLEIDKFISACIKVLKKSIDDRSVIDFDDMIYLPVYYCNKFNWKMDQCPLVFLDEAQDVDSLQVAFLNLFAKRLVAVGDEYQAIYGFRGAGVESRGVMQNTFDFKFLPLSTSYRCPVSHIELAKVRNPELEAWEKAKRGHVTRDEVGRVRHYLKKDSLLMCRLNAPLMSLAMAYLKEGKDFQMSSKFPDSLKKFLRKFRCNDLGFLRESLKDWMQEQRRVFEESKKSGPYERSKEKFDCVMILIQNSTSFQDVLGKLSAISEGKRGPKFFTIHGSKGLEAEHVIYYHTELVPSKHAVAGTWGYEQELNLDYVAKTRSKDTLILLEGG